MARLVHDYHPVISAELQGILQGLLHQLSGLNFSALSAIKTAVDAELGRQLNALDIDALTEEEWDALNGTGFPAYRDCVRLVRARTGLSLVDSKAYVDSARTKGRSASLVGANPPDADTEAAMYAQDVTADLGSLAPTEGRESGPVLSAEARGALAAIRRLVAATAMSCSQRQAYAVQLALLDRMLGGGGDVSAPAL
jgi:hypothetical protein